MAYGNKTCYDCGVKQPANHMERVTESYNSGRSDNRVTAGNLAWAAVSDTAAKKVKRTIVANNRRSYTRNREVWKCTVCSGNVAESMKTMESLVKKASTGGWFSSPKPEEVQNKLKEIFEYAKAYQKEVHGGFRANNLSCDAKRVFKDQPMKHYPDIIEREEQAEEREKKFAEQKKQRAIETKQLAIEDKQRQEKNLADVLEDIKQFEKEMLGFDENGFNQAERLLKMKYERLERCEKIIADCEETLAKTSKDPRLEIESMLKDAPVISEGKLAEKATSEAEQKVSQAKASAIEYASWKEAKRLKPLAWYYKVICWLGMFYGGSLCLMIFMPDTPENPATVGMKVFVGVLAAAFLYPSIKALYFRPYNTVVRKAKTYKCISNQGKGAE